jgi:hypothetical protein
VTAPLPIRVLTQARYLRPDDRIVVMHDTKDHGARKANHTHTTVRSVDGSSNHVTKVMTDAFPIRIHLGDANLVEVTHAVRTVALHCMECKASQYQPLSLEDMVGAVTAGSGNAYVQVELREEIAISVVCVPCAGKTSRYRAWGE